MRMRAGERVIAVLVFEVLGRGGGGVGWGRSVAGDEGAEASGG